ncbi:translation initiation factor IF-2 [Candidatus Dojkabacteria bacterium]|nr:translation initiation factor IF-2 [Candidatus Dojkabacteria bacterium]
MAAKKKTSKVEYRPPVVAFLGHVDHGKTTILDKIRKTSVQEKEVGGITQGITGWSVDVNGKDITFIDTPGHEAFDLMRSRGGEVADIVLLVVAVNDGVKPQTKESIEIIKRTKRPVIVVLNKIDIAGVDKEKVKRDLATEGIVVESSGGDVPCVEVSGKTGKGIEDLLDMILLVAEVNEVGPKNPPEGLLGEAYVLESVKHKSRGNVSTLILTSGKARTGDFVVFKYRGKILVEKIKGFIDNSGTRINEVDQGYSANLLGLCEILNLGQRMYIVADSKGDFEKLFQEEPVESKEEKKEEEPVPADEEGEEDDEKADENLLSMLLSGKTEIDEEKKILKVVVKAQSEGSLRAVLKSLDQLNEDGEIVKVIRSGVGNIVLGDVEYAHTMKAIVIGFSVEVDCVAGEYGQKNKVLVRTYDLIYNLIDEIDDAAEAIQEPEEKEEIVGKGKVKQVFVLSDGTVVVGTKVESGEIKHGLKCRISRDDEVVVEGQINSMRVGKDKVTSVKSGSECGVIIDGKGDIKDGDVVQCYRIVKS